MNDSDMSDNSKSGGSKVGGESLEMRIMFNAGVMLSN